MLKVDLFTDIVCPWCFIGSTRLTDVLKELKLDAEVVHHPFQLDPTTPPEGVNLGENLKKKYGRDPKPMFARVQDAAKEVGIALDFDKQPMSYPTLKAHTLLRHAAAKGTQRAFIKDLYAAYFLEGKNIADDAVLSTLAQAHGFSDDEARALIKDDGELKVTRAEAQHAAEQGISGVPFFIFNNKLAVSGSQSADVFKQAITRSLE